jgi:hypothetical protein
MPRRALALINKDQCQALVGSVPALDAVTFLEFYEEAHLHATNHKHQAKELKIMNKIWSDFNEGISYYLSGGHLNHPNLAVPISD